MLPAFLIKFNDNCAKIPKLFSPKTIGPTFNRIGRRWGRRAAFITPWEYLQNDFVAKKLHHPMRNPEATTTCSLSFQVFCQVRHF